MLPLKAIALGLVIVGLRAAVGGYDLVADPLGWVLVLVGLARLPEDLPRRGLALGAATLALLTAAALWFPALRDPVADADPALGWATSLPQLAVLVGITAALPILVLGGGIDVLGPEIIPTRPA